MNLLFNGSGRNKDIKCETEHLIRTKEHPQSCRKLASGLRLIHGKTQIMQSKIRLTHCIRTKQSPQCSSKLASTFLLITGKMSLAIKTGNGDYKSWHQIRYYIV